MPGKRARKRRLESAVASIQQRWGPEALQRGTHALRAAGLPTGFAQLDAALGIGGIPRGHLNVLSGIPTSGKRTLAALILSQAQTANARLAAYLDLGGTCDPDYLERCGVSLDRLLVARPDDARQALDMLLTLAERPEISVVIFDHWAALGADASLRRYAAAALDSLAPRLARSGVTALVLDEPLNWWRGLLSAALGDPADLALGQHCAVRLSLQRERWLSLGPDVRGYQVQVEVQKNKVGPAGKTVTLEILFNGTIRGEGL